ncbi:MAG: valS [Parcubacteria group bacterium]|nr:valS [Parcubacteria group bacterium]
MNERFLKPYDPVETETRIYEAWEQSQLFNPDVNLEKGYANADAPVFSIVLPPPNVTGILHMGSALMIVIEDIFVRFSRMKGMRTLWIPGTDSAAIATQTRVEKDIQKAENLSRHDLGREELLKRIDSFVESSKSTIISQIKGMGASVDWSRYAYTMDEARYKAVMEAFVRMYEAGLIYRGNRIVNWDPKGQTTISDDEIVYEEREAKLYTFKYSKDFPISISTTRPETKVGDTAVAVHPDDARYQQFIGQEFDLTFCDVPLHIKIIADREVDPEFGTGALGVTPAHSHIDWMIADRHGLSRPQVINEYAKMEVGGRLNGKKVNEAREMVVAWLQEEGLLEKEEKISQNISTAERTGGIIEPLPKLQWFIDVNKDFTMEHSEIPGIKSGSSVSLKHMMRQAVESEEINILGEGFRKTYLHWVNNLRDWCISRQIWFGHRIPVWYRGDEIYVGVKAPTDEGWQQDSDVLDTWFSSALWTFTTLGWPAITPDLKTYHPTTLIETGYDILPFWVSRMIMMSGFFLGQIPFKTVYLHGLVRDAQGRKISKSLGNNIDPVDMAKKYGTDAVRFSLIAGTAVGTDSKISEDKIRGYKNFANKLWNITRFVLSNTEGFEYDPNRKYTDSDIEEMNSEFAAATAELENWRLHNASERIYHYIWHSFADRVIEESKNTLFDESASEEKKDEVRWKLYHLLSTSLKTLHPFMPFVTEEIWQNMPHKKERPFLMVETWPR